MSGKIEVNIRLIIVVKNKNCQAYLCVFSILPSSSLSRRFCIFNKLSYPHHGCLAKILFSTAQAQPHFGLVSSFNGESVRSAVAPHSPIGGAHIGRNEAVLVLLKTNLGHVEDDEESEMRAY